MDATSEGVREGQWGSFGGVGGVITDTYSLVLLAVLPVEMGAWPQKVLRPIQCLRWSHPLTTSHSVPSGHLNLLQRSPAEVTNQCPTTVSGWSGRGRPLTAPIRDSTSEGVTKVKVLVSACDRSALEVTRGQRSVANVPPQCLCICGCSLVPTEDFCSSGGALV